MTMWFGKANQTALLYQDEKVGSTVFDVIMHNSGILIS